VVTFETTIHDSGVALLGDAFLRDLGIDPVGIAPHVGFDLAKLHSRGSVVRHRLLEGRVEVIIVEENVGVVIPPVEVTLDGLDGLDDTIQLLVSREDDEYTIGSGLAGVRLETSGHEDLVVLIADFPAKLCQIPARNGAPEEVGHERLAGRKNRWQHTLSLAAHRQALISFLGRKDV
jgi:hypothetical protein